MLIFIEKNTKIKTKGSKIVNIKHEWGKIQNAIQSNDTVKLKGAVLVADKLVDHVLKTRGYTGNSLGERVKKARTELGDTYQAFWDAHRTRNRIVHEIETEVRHHESQEALRKFEKVLKKLGVI